MKKLYHNFMMRGLLISVLTFSSVLYSQIKISYEVKYKPDSTKNVFNVEEMALKINAPTSYFYNETKFRLDSLYNKITNEYQKTRIAPPVSLKYELNFAIEKKFQTEEIFEIKNVKNRNYRYNIKMPLFNWQLIEERKTILNYKVKKASTSYGGRNWIAWYTEEIPLSDGPFKFHGLPGIILEIHDTKFDYSFLAAGIVIDNSKIITPYDVINTTETKYKLLVDKIIEDPAIFVRESIMRSKSVTMSDTSGKEMSNNELYNRIREEFNRFINGHNNPIEKNTIWIK